MRAPARKAATAAMSTAPAARSLIRLICGWYCREIKSMVFSRTVLIISMIHTIAMQMMSSTPSVVVTWKYSESSSTTKDAASWICALWPVRKKCRMPSMAYAKLFSLPTYSTEIVMLMCVITNLYGWRKNVRVKNYLLIAILAANENENVTIVES